MRRLAVSLRKAWNRLWFAEFDPLSVSVFRISLGVLMLFTFIGLMPSWDFFFSDHGISALPPRRSPWGAEQMANFFYWTNGILPTKVLAWLGVLASIAFTVGYLTRAATIFLFLMFASMIHRCSPSVNGEDLVYRMLLFYSCFAPLGYSLSVDAWLLRSKHPGITRPAPIIWAVRMMQINFALIYVFTQLRKVVGDPGWLNGDVMYFTMANTMWSRWPWPMLFAHAVVTKLATWASLFMEAAFPLLVWFRPFRLWVILALAAIHVGIAITLQNVTFFSLSMVAGLMIFVPAEDMRRIGRLLDPRTKSRLQATGL